MARKPTIFRRFCDGRRIREKLERTALYGEPAQLCDAGIRKIKGLG
jgi:hypothetical protein